MWHPDYDCIANIIISSMFQEHAYYSIVTACACHDIISPHKFKIRGNVCNVLIIMLTSLDIIEGLYKMRLYYCDVLCSCLASSVNIISHNIMRHEPSHPYKINVLCFVF